MRVEIRWLERAVRDNQAEFNSYLKDMNRTDTPSAVETTFKTWLDEKVKGRKIIVSDLEFYVDGRFYPLEMAEENQYFRRIDDAADK